jgi:uncharacterized YigZ family protein
LAQPARLEIDKIQGSRFIAWAAPVEDAAAARELLEEARQTFADARHHCFAWRLPPPGIATRQSDGDEPAGSAGAPILRQIEGLGLFGAAVVVTRYFGGTKLGVGGLMRAYGGAARAALEAGGLRWISALVRWQIELPYECQGVLTGWQREFEAETRRAEYGAAIRLEVALPQRLAEVALQELRERTAGRAQLTPPVG